tara:strand:+ start:417 stop:725 length:309 start_codon:yes stop_codon:yes gene_type:complete
MGLRGNNERTFAEYVELDIAVNDDSPNAYIYKRLDSQITKPVSERSWYLGVPISNQGNGNRLSLKTADEREARRKANMKVAQITTDLAIGIDVCGRSVLLGL